MPALWPSRHVPDRIVVEAHGTLRPVGVFDRVGEHGEERGRRQLYGFGIACLRGWIEYGEGWKDKGGVWDGKAVVAMIHW